MNQSSKKRIFYTVLSHKTLYYIKKVTDPKGLTHLKTERYTIK